MAGRLNVFLNEINKEFNQVQKTFNDKKEISSLREQGFEPLAGDPDTGHYNHQAKINRNAIEQKKNALKNAMHNKKVNDEFERWMREIALEKASEKASVGVPRAPEGKTVAQHDAREQAITNSKEQEEKDRQKRLKEAEGFNALVTQVETRVVTQKELDAASRGPKNLLGRIKPTPGTTSWWMAMFQDLSQTEQNTLRLNTGVDESFLTHKFVTGALLDNDGLGVNRTRDLTGGEGDIGRYEAPGAGPGPDKGDAATAGPGRKKP